MALDVDNLALARRYLEAIERGETADVLASFLAADVVQEELPNRLTPRGARRDLADLRDAAERGRRVMAAQRYEVLNAVTSGDLVALEVRWTGTLAVPFEALPAGGQMHARFAVFLEFRGGKIVRQRNYDCFDPW
jgi:ketosteroid isomerase-like protein